MSEILFALGLALLILLSVTFSKRLVDTRYSDLSPPAQRNLGSSYATGLRGVTGPQLDFKGAVEAMNYVLSNDIASRQGFVEEDRMRLNALRERLEGLVKGPPINESSFTLAYWEYVALLRKQAREWVA